MSPPHLLAIIEATSITGPAKNLLEFARHSAAQNVRTTIATFTRDGSDNQFTRAVLAEAERHPGIALETIPERGPFDSAVVGSLRALAARVRPDIIQTHAVKSHFLARLAGLPLLAPWVAFHHGYTSTTVKTRLYNQLDRWSLPGAAAVLTVSVPFREQLSAFGIPGHRIEIVHNAIPSQWGSQARRPEAAASWRAANGIGPDRKVVLIVGRLSREKDHLTLLEAVNQLRPSEIPHLVIVGEGPERPRIEERVSRLGLREHVTLTGQMSSAEPWYGIADVAVLSSLTEGSPNALLEAMATNVPVVATAVGGIPEIVTDQESALLVPPRDAAAMSAAIGRLLNDPTLADRLRQRGRELILTRHDPAARSAKLISIYLSLIGPPLCP